jgi:hypothetical protein
LSYDVIHALGLGAELFRSAGRFLGVGSILVRDFIHLGDGRIDLIAPLGLLLIGSGGNLGPAM